MCMFMFGQNISPSLPPSLPPSLSLWTISTTAIHTYLRIHNSGVVETPIGNLLYAPLQIDQDTTIMGNRNMARRNMLGIWHVVLNWVIIIIKKTNRSWVQTWLQKKCLWGSWCACNVPAHACISSCIPAFWYGYIPSFLGNIPIYDWFKALCFFTHTKQATILVSNPENIPNTSKYI